MDVVLHSDDRMELVLLVLSWVNPSGQLSTMQPLAYSLQQGELKG